MKRKLQNTQNKEASSNSYYMWLMELQYKAKGYVPVLLFINLGMGKRLLLLSVTFCFSIIIIF